MNTLAHAIDVVLVQDNYHIAYGSRKLNDNKKWYKTHKKEMIIVVHCLDAWRHYLLGKKFTMLIDNVANTSRSKISLS